MPVFMLMDTCSDRLASRVGAHPFTTIDPHFASTYYTYTCACEVLGMPVCGAQHGHGTCTTILIVSITRAYWVGYESKRRIPITIKDIAGLVPGASEV